MYTSLLHSIVKGHGMARNHCADDSQMYISCKPSEIVQAIKRLQDYQADVFVWLIRNNLSLNTNKSEFLVFGTMQTAAKVNDNDVILNIDGLPLKPIHAACDLGVWFNSQLNFDVHISKVCQTCSFYIQ